MWKSNIEVLEAGRTHKVSITRDSEPLAYSEVITLWQRDHSFRAFFFSVLAEAPFAAYFLETPPVTESTLDRPFEFVLVDSPQLASVAPEPRAFLSYFESQGDGVIAFPNLGKDAVLVVPCPRAPLATYPHLGAFVRGAPESQQHALWRAVGAALVERLSEQPIWLSTSGLGVYWVHIRLDSCPKYYTFRPYAQMCSGANNPVRRVL